MATKASADRAGGAGRVPNGNAGRRRTRPARLLLSEAIASLSKLMATSEGLARYAELLNAHPSLAAYGVRLTFPDEHRLRIEVGQVLASMRGGMGDDAVVNGGVLSALCDLMIGSTAGLVDPGVRSATVQLSIRFERPLRGQRIVGEARVDHSTGRTLFAAGELSDD